MSNIYNPSLQAPNSQTDVRGVRVNNTAYRNLTGAPLYVSAGGYGLTTVATTLSGYTDGNANPILLVASCQYTPAGTDIRTIFLIVLPGNYYRVNLSGAGSAYTVWTEWN